MKVYAEFYTLSALSQGTVLILVEKKTGWASWGVWTLMVRGKSVTPVGNLTVIPRLFSP